ncbi:DUF6069 family protein [Streptomonospora wellingtoniae]|uniref:DUF6069 family protein n=1 Tax=Streptomonospora wellingtoniae TaxID=3075544 RepID=A0ABU2KN82_9ACTN|nr:DUF6069 family protein [Streptomonospora sp. DSM 45055]MDT0300724.1 DUF6069 family protein [Streptomonospora sp. DSM 45055]
MTSRTGAARAAENTTPEHTRSAGGRVLRRALAAVGAAVAALVLWAVAVPVAGIEVTAYRAGTLGPIGPVSIGASALAMGLAGWALLAVLERLMKRPGPVWTSVATAVMLLSLAGPLISTADSASMFVLLAMHLVVGVAVILVLAPTARRR